LVASNGPLMLPSASSRYRSFPGTLGSKDRI
jgi:hypothetical protein